MIDIEAMSLREIAQQCQRTAVEHGFAEKPVNIDRKLVLAIGELVEAQNELRDGWAPGDVYFTPKNGDAPRDADIYDFPPDEKPEGFPIELADGVIRIFQLAEDLDIDIAQAIALKMNYNEGRPFLHGKQF